MKITTGFVRVATLALCAALSSCADEDTGDPGTAAGAPQALAAEPEAAAARAAAAPKPGKVSPDDVPVDIGAVINRVHFAFRREGDTFTGGDYAYGVRVTDRGALTVTPRYPIGVTAGRPVGELKEPPPPPQIVKGMPATFTTTSIGGVASSGRSVQAEDGSLVRSAGAGVSERVRNSADGVEQSWELAQRPAGGDLVIRVKVEGPLYSGSTDKGLHFIDPFTTLGLRYGAATWIDAGGQRTTIAPTWEGGEIALRVPAAVLDGSSYPTVLDPIIGAEFGTDTAITGSAFGSQDQQVIASNGTDYLVVWRDSRDGDSDIWGARFTGTGTVQDPNGILISGAANGQEYPAVTYSSTLTSYFVVWHDFRVGSGHIYGARVTTGGVVSDASGIDLSPGETTAQYYPTVEFNGTNFYVAWTDYRPLGSPDTSPNIYGTRVNTSMTVLDGGDTLISTGGAATTGATSTQQLPVIHFYGGQWVVSWSDYRTSGTTSQDVYLTRLNAFGAVTDLNGVIVTNAASSQGNVDMICNNAGTVRCGFVWTDYTSTGTSPDLQFRVYEPSTNTFAAGTTTLSATQSQDYANIDWDGTNFTAFWSDYRSGSNYDIYGGRINTAGALLDGTGVAVISRINHQLYPAAVYAGGRHVIAFQDDRSSDTAGYDVYAARATTITSVTDPDGIRISSGANPQNYPAAAFDGTNSLIVWQDGRAGSSWDIYGTRVSSTGTVLDALGIAIATGTARQQNPAVTFGGGNYLVVYEDEPPGLSRDVRGIRVSTAGSVLDAAGIAIGADAGLYEYNPDAASDGTNYFVTFEGNSTSGIAAQRVTSGGGLTGSKINVTTPCTGCPTGPEYDYGSAVAWNGTNYLVSYVRDRFDIFMGWDIYAIGGARVNTSGTVISDSLTGYGMPFEYIYGTDVASSGSQWLVAYARVTSSADVYGQFFASDGTLSANAVINNQAVDQTNPAIAFDGFQYAVTWMDYRNYMASGWDVYATWVSTSGTVLDATGVIVSNTAAHDQNPAIVAANNGRLLNVYQRYDSAAGATSDRVKGRFISWADPHGTVCVSGATCTSGLCVDGVCCNAACGGGAANDCLACSTTAGGTVNGTCGNSVSTYTCRAAGAGGCDVAENCTGSSPTCPVDGFQPSTVQCRASAGVCDPAENCTGSNATCPINTYSPSSTVCRPSTGICDLAENCTGSAAACPADTTYAPASTVCRAAVTVCDVAENCTGASNTCPADLFAPASTVCRGLGGTCDVVENCTGASTVCPTDLYASTSTLCRGLGGVCDAAEYCPGTGVNCPVDVYASTSTVCRVSAGLCDPAENCSGTGVNCPADLLSPSSTVCRAAVPGGCDVAENCTGTMAACPTDVFAPSSTVCRASTGVCDPAENCTGGMATCPTNVFSPASTVCRASTDLCDAAENCTGSSGPCPADLLSPSSTVCRAAVPGGCDLAENCTGTSAVCPADVLAPATTVCRAVAGLCDVAENCTGSSTVCPPDVLLSSSVVCRAVAGLCDVAENCNGVSAACPADNFLPASTVCRTVAGPCDVAESCPGTGANCPTDAFVPGTIPCRPSAGVCDVVELCPGTNSSCPPDGFAPTTTECRASTDVCDPAENCTSTGAACPTDAFLPDTTGCDDGDECTANDECATGVCQPGPHAIAVDPDPIAFPDTAVGTTAADIDFTVSNIGTATINVTEVISSNTLVFPEVADPTPASLNGGDSFMGTIDFAPNTASMFSETLTVTSDICPPVVVPLTGQGEIPGLDISPNPFDFGAVSTDGPYPTQTFTITNTGAAPFDVMTIVLDNTNDFVLMIPTLPMQVAGSGGTLEFQVEGHPMLPEEVKTAVVTVTITGGGVATIDLSETAVCPTCVPDAGPDAKPVDAGADANPDDDGGAGADASVNGGDGSLDPTSYYACDCRTSNTDPTTPLAGTLLLLAGALLLRRRRR